MKGTNGGKYKISPIAPRWKYGGMRKGFKFYICPKCGKRGVTSRVSRGKRGKVIAHRICKYCGWYQAGDTR